MDRQAVITKLAKCQHNPIKDAEALEKFSEAGLAALEAHCSAQAEAFKALEDELDDTKAELKVAQEAVAEKDKTLRAAEAEVRKAKRTPTEEEWIAQAPPAIKTLIERQKQHDDEKREELVGALKTAQQEFNEEELKAMPIEQLERFSRILKVDAPPVDYSTARPAARRSAQENDIYANPPDPYKEALERRAASRKAN